MTTHRTLKQIADDMQEAVHCGDQEIAHVDADDLLLEVIAKLASVKTTRLKNRLLNIIKLYKKVDKWYS